MTYHRYSSPDKSPYTLERYGIFVAVWHLVRDKRVSPQEEADYWIHRNWYEENLPLPPFYADGNPRRAITWFKDSVANHPLMERLAFYRDLASRHGLPIHLETAGDPGEIIYEDSFQVAAVRQRHLPVDPPQPS
ncbi:hypothetical protein [Luteolibacter marinus]|uniref:hypothetical protein n=1 Tax=Luteolibacter marinus TaxID=2776705 RepID=UPI001868C160|nr:hypothetical protein [Luteolibacter marinus]